MSSRKHPQQLSFSLTPLLILPTTQVPLLSLKDHLMRSSSNEILSSEFPLLFHSPRDMPRLPSTNVLDPISLLPLSCDGSISFDTKSFLVWPKAFKVVFYAGTHIPSDDHSVSLHHPDFQRRCFTLGTLNPDPFLAAHSFLAA